MTGGQPSTPETGSRGPEGDGGQQDSRPREGSETGELCDYCGAAALAWRKCKLVCERCGNIVKSCADL